MRTTQLAQKPTATSKVREAPLASHTSYRAADEAQVAPRYRVIGEAPGRPRPSRGGFCSVALKSRAFSLQELPVKEHRGRLVRQEGVPPVTWNQLATPREGYNLRTVTFMKRSILLTPLALVLIAAVVSLSRRTSERQQAPDEKRDAPREPAQPSSASSADAHLAIEGSHAPNAKTITVPDTLTPAPRHGAVAANAPAPSPTEVSQMAEPPPGAVEEAVTPEVQAAIDSLATSQHDAAALVRARAVFEACLDHDRTSPRCRRGLQTATQLIEALSKPPQRQP